MKKLVICLFFIFSAVSLGFSKQMDILLCFSDNYKFQAETLIMSLLSSKLPQEHYNINCFTPDIEEGKIQELNGLVRRLDNNKSFILFHKVPLFKDIKKKSTSYASLRLLAPKYLKNTDKVIYLDTDMIVNGSLKELWDINIGRYYFAGVIDTKKTRENFKNEMWEKFNIYEVENYINSGMLIINIKEIRKDLMSYYKLTLLPDVLADILPYPDQDIINKYFSDKILRIPRKWNWLCYDWGQAPDDTVIFHYAGPIKPWGNSRESWHLTQRVKDPNENIDLPHADLWHKYNDQLKKENGNYKGDSK
ncbi:MAG: glycosyltransferase family 8 protein [Endomicrobium sp.]|jgi:lipopolysaccharide biosynthesis glycosyltransferase|nr:glycosyltransferase family 8 protein [Endomicrobium sp.]